MIDLDAIKITPSDGEVLRLLAQGCSNQKIAEHLNISPRTVKQDLRTLFLRAGITRGRKRVKLATARFEKEQTQQCNPAISERRRKFKSRLQCGKVSRTATLPRSLAPANRS